MTARAARFIRCSTIAAFAFFFRFAALGLDALDTQLMAQSPPAAANTPAQPAEPPLQWHDVAQWGVEGRAWPDLERTRWFDRFPAQAQARVTGIKRLYYLAGDDLLGDDAEAATDGSHPSDLGMVRQADRFEPILRKALAGRR